ncbi:MAG: hypothetical protein LBV79_10570 [Candidatus Adiutrix sp.]|jgi:hypothetical protein|nr:hypothetical protein [Candidatus Adiutrix sp.]
MMSAQTFATQLEAVKFLNDYGYKIQKSKLSKDFKAGHVETNAEGHFEKRALLGYAAIHCKAFERLEDRAGTEANLERIKADAENKRAMAERNRLKLERELGNTISREEHETELAARAAFFRREIETFGPRLAPRIIALVAGDDQRLEELIQFWREETEIWMDAWARDRAFAVPQGVADETGPAPEAGTPADELDEQEDGEDDLAL